MSKRGFAHLLAVTLAKACIWAMAKGKPKHASGNLFRKGRMASANAGNKRLTASGVAMSLATTGCGVFFVASKYVAGFFVSWRAFWPALVRRSEHAAS